MTRTKLLFRTFAWAAVGFLVTGGALAAFSENLDFGSLALALIAAVVSGVIAVLQSLKFTADTPMGRALSQLVQMLVAGLGTLLVADWGWEEVGDLPQAIGKLVIASVVGALQAYYMNVPPPPEPGPVA